MAPLPSETRRIWQLAAPFLKHSVQAEAFVKTRSLKAFKFKGTGLSIVWLRLNFPIFRNARSGFINPLFGAALALCVNMVP